MKVTHEIRIDIKNPGNTEVVNSVQSDTYSRDISFFLSSGGVAWSIPEAANMRASYKKPDGTKGIYDLLPDGSPAASISGGNNNILTVAIAPQVLTAAGKVDFSVSIIEGEAVINTFPVIIDVAPLPGFGGKSENYYSISGLPQITAADNGKVLQVVDGMWVAGVAVAGSGATLTGVSITEHADGSVTMVNTLSSGEVETIGINAAATELTYNGTVIPMTWVTEGTE